MTKQVTLKERERILTQMVLILLGFFILAFLFTFFLPLEKRFIPFSAIILLGIFVSGIYASKKFARDYDEFLWGITAFLMLSIFFGILFYQLYLVGIGIAQPVFNLILYIFLWLPISMATGFSAFEVLSSRKIKKPFSFHAKRFIGRMISVGIYLLLIMIIFVLLSQLLASLISERYILTTFIFSILIACIPTYYILVKNQKVKQFLDGLEKGEQHYASQIRD